MGGGSLFWSLFSRNCRKAGESKDGGNGREAMEGATACGKFGEECPGMDSECLNCSETLQGGTETALVLKDQKLAIDLSFWICSCKSASPPALPGQNHVVHFFLRMLFFRCVQLSSTAFGSCRAVFVADPDVPSQEMALKNQTRMQRSVAQAKREGKAVKNAGSVHTGQMARNSLFRQECRLSSHLCALLGMPVLVADGEAEDLCAKLNRSRIVDACVTPDSDCLCFGAECVYKYFNMGAASECNPSFERYRFCEIQRKLGLGRRELVAAMVLLGCDFTDGAKGVGVKCVQNLFEALRGRDVIEVLREWAAGKDAGITFVKDPKLEGSRPRHCKGRMSSDEVDKVLDLFLRDATEAQVKVWKVKGRHLVMIRWDYKNSSKRYEEMADYGEQDSSTASFGTQATGTSPHPRTSDRVSTSQASDEYLSICAAGQISGREFGVLEGYSNDKDGAVHQGMRGDGEEGGPLLETREGVEAVEACDTLGPMLMAYRESLKKSKAKKPSTSRRGTATGIDHTQTRLDDGAFFFKKVKGTRGGQARLLAREGARKFKGLDTGVEEVHVFAEAENGDEDDVYDEKRGEKMLTGVAGVESMIDLFAENYDDDADSFGQDSAQPSQVVAPSRHQLGLCAAADDNDDDDDDFGNDRCDDSDDVRKGKGSEGVAVNSCEGTKRDGVVVILDDDERVDDGQIVHEGKAKGRDGGADMLIGEKEDDSCLHSVQKEEVKMSRKRVKGSEEELVHDENQINKKMTVGEGALSADSQRAASGNGRVMGHTRGLQSDDCMASLHKERVGATQDPSIVPRREDLNMQAGIAPSRHTHGEDSVSEEEALHFPEKRPKSMVPNTGGHMCLGAGVGEDLTSAPVQRTESGAELRSLLDKNATQASSPLKRVKVNHDFGWSADTDTDTLTSTNLLAVKGIDSVDTGTGVLGSVRGKLTGNTFGMSHITPKGKSKKGCSTTNSIPSITKFFSVQSMQSGQGDLPSSTPGRSMSGVASSSRRLLDNGKCDARSEGGEGEWMKIENNEGGAAVGGTGEGIRDVVGRENSGNRSVSVDGKLLRGERGVLQTCMQELEGFESDFEEAVYECTDQDSCQYSNHDEGGAHDESNHKEPAQESTDKETLQYDRSDNVSDSNDPPESDQDTLFVAERKSQPQHLQLSRDSSMVTRSGQTRTNTQQAGTESDSHIQENSTSATRHSKKTRRGQARNEMHQYHTELDPQSREKKKIERKSLEVRKELYFDLSESPDVPAQDKTRSRIPPKMEERSKELILDLSESPEITGPKTRTRPRINQEITESGRGGRGRKRVMGSEKATIDLTDT